MTPTEIRTLRRSLGLTQAQLGRLLGLSGRDLSRTVRSWESGDKLPSGPVTNLMILLNAENDPRVSLRLAFANIWAKAGIVRLDD